MKIFIKLIPVGLFALLLITGGKLYAQTAATSISIISGSVTDPEGRVVTGIPIQVFAYRSGALVAGTFVMETGTYSIPLSVGSWFIGSEVDPKTGFIAAGTDSALEVAAPGVLLKRDLMLRRVEAVVNGRILRPDGTSLANTLVNVFGSSDAEVFSTEVNDDGSYQFFLPADRYAVNAFSSSDNNVINPERQIIDLAKGKFAYINSFFKDSDRIIHGRVMDDKGPVADVLISARSEKGYYSATYTRADGTYALKVRDFGSWRIKAAQFRSGVSYESDESLILLSGKDIEKNIILKSGALLPGAAQGKFPSVSGGETKLANGVSVFIPSMAVTADQVTVKVEAAVKDSPNSVTPLGAAYEVKVFGDNGARITELQKPAVVALPYTVADLASVHGDVSRLKMFRFDENVGAWRPLANSSVDTKNKVVVAPTRFLAGFVVTQSEGRTEAGQQQTVQSAAAGVVGSGSGGAAFTAPQPPTIGNVNVSSSSEGSARVFYTAFIISLNESYQVERSLSVGGPFSAVGPGKITAPFPSSGIEDTGLAPNTTYFYRIVAENSIGKSQSQVVSVQTAKDLTPPTVGDPTTLFSPDSVVFSFATNEPTKAVVNYGTTGASEFSVKGANNFVNVHNITAPIAELKAGTAYAGQIVVEDAGGNKVQKTISFVVPQFSAAAVVPPLVTAPQTPPTTAAVAPKILFIRNLTRGAQGDDVKRLQVAMNERGFTVAVTGPGSPGNETSFFGPGLQSAVRRWQLANGLPGTGFFGPASRERLNADL
jgi:hypothetical protein